MAREGCPQLAFRKVDTAGTRVGSTAQSRKSQRTLSFPYRASMLIVPDVTFSFMLCQTVEMISDSYRHLVYMKDRSSNAGGYIVPTIHSVLIQS